MGFFSSKATCAICGETIGLNRFLIKKLPDGRELWKCPKCAKRKGILMIDERSGKVTLVDKEGKITVGDHNPSKEIRKKCNICGHIFCYTEEDLKKNRQQNMSALASSLGTIGGALSGNYVAGAVNQGNAQRAMNQIVDYNRCPKCHSTDLSFVSSQQIERDRAQSAKSAFASDTTIEDLKKYKELLDSGIITQEEFDAKKKQILGL